MEQFLIAILQLIFGFLSLAFVFMAGYLAGRGDQARRTPVIFKRLIKELLEEKTKK